MIANILTRCSWYDTNQHFSSISHFYSMWENVCVYIICVCVYIHIYMAHAWSSNSLWPHTLWPSRLLCPGDLRGKKTGVGCHSLLQGIFPTQGLNSGLLHCRQILYHWATWEALCIYIYKSNKILSVYKLSSEYICICVLSRIWLFVTPWTVAHQFPLSMEFSGKEYWSGLPCSPPEDLPNPGIKLGSLALQVDSLPAEQPGKTVYMYIYIYVIKWNIMHVFPILLHLFEIIQFLLIYKFSIILR